MSRSRPKPWTWFMYWVIIWSVFFVLPAILVVLPRSEQGAYVLVMSSLVITYILFLIVSSSIRPLEQPERR